MFDTLRRLFQSRTKTLPPSSKPDNNKLPLGLSRDQVEQLQALTALIPYKHYSVALEHLYEQNVQAMLRGLSHEAYMFQCGVCFALEQVASLPESLTLKLRDLDARRPTNTPEPDARAVFTNTPFWAAFEQRRTRQYGGS